MNKYKNRLKRLEEGKQQGIFIAIGAGPDSYDTSDGIKSREQVDRIEKSGRKMTRIEGDWTGV